VEDRHALTCHSKPRRSSGVRARFSTKRELPLAGFSVIEAQDVEEVVRLVSNTPCARARGVIEIRPFLDDGAD
jgi:hypothetical protein